MYRNVTFAALKLLFLLADALATPGDKQETIIFLTWVLGQLASILLFAFVLRYRGRSIRPDFHLLRPLMKTVLSHDLLNLITQGPSLLMRFIRHRRIHGSGQCGVLRQSDDSERGVARALRADDHAVHDRQRGTRNDWRPLEVLTFRVRDRQYRGQRRLLRFGRSRARRVWPSYAAVGARFCRYSDWPPLP
jgi:hypothetical protein